MQLIKKKSKQGKTLIKKTSKMIRITRGQVKRSVMAKKRQEQGRRRSRLWKRGRKLNLVEDIENKLAEKDT